MRRMVEIGEGHMPSLPNPLLLRLCSRYQYRSEFSCYLVDTSFCSLNCLLPWTIYLFSTAKTAIWLVRVNCLWQSVSQAIANSPPLIFFFYFFNLKFTAAHDIVTLVDHQNNDFHSFYDSELECTELDNTKYNHCYPTFPKCRNRKGTTGIIRLNEKGRKMREDSRYDRETARAKWMIWKLPKKR